MWDAATLSEEGRGSRVRSGGGGRDEAGVIPGFRFHSAVTVGGVGWGVGN